MKTDIAKRLIGLTAAFFDSRLISRVDTVVQCDGQQSVYVDPLGTATIPDPTSTGHNLYKFIPVDKKFVQELHFQSGSPANGVNGLSNEAAISAVLHRISKQNESFPSPYNQLAILCLQTAIAALHLRVKDRKEFGIYDTNVVEPTAEQDAEISKALAVVNSIGLLGDLIIKFDRSYALHVPGTVHKFFDRVADYVNPDEECTTITASTMMAAMLQVTGVNTFWRGMAASITKTMGVDNGSKSGEDSSTDNPA